MHNIAKGVNKTIRAAGKLVMMPFFAPDMSNTEEACEYLAEEFCDIWFTADIGCFLNGLGKLMTIQKALIGTAAGPKSESATSAAAPTEEAEEAEEAEAKGNPDFVRTC
jgi:hypothetical protein